MQLHQLIPLLQVAIAPVILISGVGLLLLSMTNRLGRVIDRSRLLADILGRAVEAQRAHVTEQLQILSRRAGWLRRAITLASLCLLLTAVLIIVLFVGMLAGAETGLPVIILFITAMTCLVGSLIAFILDIHLSLAALRTEIAAKTSSGS
jgi:hypothetical protein